MSLDKSIYEYYRKKMLLQIAKEEGLIPDSEEMKLLKEIKNQTSDKIADEECEEWFKDKGVKEGDYIISAG